MSVYTKITFTQLASFLQQYDVGELISFDGISDGIENTNYFVTTSRGEFVLTLFEHLRHEELPYFLELMALLSEHDVPSAHPLADRKGNFLQTLAERPTALVQRLDGKAVQAPNLQQCTEVGAALGKMHREGQCFQYHRDNVRGPHWWHVTSDQVLPKVSAAEAELLRAEIDYQMQYSHLGLPRGVIHADLFRDNVLFVDSELTGIIDFYYACNDVLLYDVAITVNDWCSCADGSLDKNMAEQLLLSYHEQRAFEPVEHEAWQTMLRAGALRFWLSRLKDKYFPRPGEITHIKDPSVFQHILQHRMSDVVALPMC